jgi:ATP-binding cassette, subfamily B, bacterial
MAVNPLLLMTIIDQGIVARRTDVVVWLSLAIAGLTLLGAVAAFIQTWSSGRISQGLVCDLRAQIFDHVQRQPVSFFTRTQTGSLVSRLNGDILMAERAVGSLPVQILSTSLTVVLTLGALFYLSWQVTLVSLAIVPLMIVPSKVFGRRLQRLARQEMELDAELGSMMNERFNVSGAMLAKLYGRSAEDATVFARRAARIRDVGITMLLNGHMFFIVATVIVGLATALLYGLGGWFVIAGSLQIGSLVAMVTLVLRLYGPLNQLTNVHADFMTGLVSFDRLFEVLDLKPLVVEAADARDLPVNGPDGRQGLDIEFDRVSFRYPAADQVSLASLETTSARAREPEGDALVLRELTFRVPAGSTTALVGPSGAGKSTISQLVSRLHDPVSGSVRIGGVDVRDLTFRSLYGSIGVVTQDAHLFHDTIEANLLYARPEASAREVAEACEAAQIWDTISALPHGLRTVVGDRGHRLSGGEKQRLALARLLLKSPPIVVLDEATAHLDSESEAAIQRALRTALTGRTSLIIAHRLSTVREADDILVIDGGQIRERGTHDELIAAKGMYSELYQTQFAPTG